MSKVAINVDVRVVLHGGFPAFLSDMIIKILGYQPFRCRTLAHMFNRGQFNAKSHKKLARAVSNGVHQFVAYVQKSENNPLQLGSLIQLENLYLVGLERRRTYTYVCILEYRKDSPLRPDE